MVPDSTVKVAGALITPPSLVRTVTVDLAGSMV
jgi:hypothetical protein